MRRRLVTAVFAAAIAVAPGTAWADHGGGYDDRRGDCRGSEGPCEDNDFSPSFQDSPVRDAFNFSPEVCLPGAECHWHSDGQGNGGQPTRS